MELKQLARVRILVFFSQNNTVRLDTIGIDGHKHSAALAKGRPGVLHGVKTYVLQSAEGQIVETHSISAGLDYPAVGPEHAWLKDTGRAEHVAATDEQALRSFRMLIESEGIIPGELGDVPLIRFCDAVSRQFLSPRIISCNLGSRSRGRYPLSRPRRRRCESLWLRGR